MKTSHRLIVLLFAVFVLALFVSLVFVDMGLTTGLPDFSSDQAFAFNLPFVWKDHNPSLVCHPPPAVPPDDLANETAIADGINDIREANGLPRLVLVFELTQAARRHSRDMADNNFLSHAGSDGSDAGRRINDSCYQWVAVGEIIAAGYGGNPSDVIQGWMNSPTHQAIILSEDYEDFGVGYASNPASSYIHYWTVDFAKRAAP